jgi:hypothetical protein
MNIALVPIKFVLINKTPPTQARPLSMRNGPSSSTAAKCRHGAFICTQCDDARQLKCAAGPAAAVEKLDARTSPVTAQAPIIRPKSASACLIGK